MNQNNAFLYSFILIFLVLGVIIPIYDNTKSYNTDILDSDDIFEPQSETEAVLTGGSVLFSLATVTFWSFGLEWWLNLFFLTPLRLMFWIIVYDKFRGI